MHNILKFFFLGMTIVSLNIMAGTQAVMQETSVDSQKIKLMTISVEGNWVRFDHEDKNESQMLFDKLNQEMIIIDHKRKTFTRLNQASLKSMQDKMLQAKQQMDAQMANMPAEQREMMMKMLGDKMKMFSPPEQRIVKLNKTDQKDTAAGYQCVVMEYFVNEIKTSEFCVTELNQLKEAKPIYESLLSLSHFFEELYQTMTNNFGTFSEMNPFAEMSQLKGFPVKVSTIKNKKVTRQSILTSINSKALAKDYFTVPKNYKENKMEAMGQ